MKPDSREAKIDSIATRALLLGPGESFAAPVEGDELYEQWCLEAISEALRRHFDAARGLSLDLAEPRTLGISARFGTIVIERPMT